MKKKSKLQFVLFYQLANETLKNYLFFSKCALKDSDGKFLFFFKLSIASFGIFWVESSINSKSNSLYYVCYTHTENVKFESTKIFFYNHSYKRYSSKHFEKTKTEVYKETAFSVKYMFRVHLRLHL